MTIHSTLQEQPPISFPIYTSKTSAEDREIIQIFLSCYRDIQFQRDDTRILSAMEKTADVTGNSDGVIAKILVDYGLKAKRESFPHEFLNHIDACVMRGNISRSIINLIETWRDHGHSIFDYCLAPVRTLSPHHYATA